MAEDELASTARDVVGEALNGVATTLRAKGREPIPGEKSQGESSAEEQGGSS